MSIRPRPVQDIQLVFHPQRDTSYVHFQDGESHPFDANATRLGRRNAWWLAEAALLSYWMPDLVRLVYSARYLGAADAARVFLLAAAVQFLVGWTKSFPVTIGRPQLRIWTHGVESLVVIPLTLVLGYEWGATGAAVAILVGMCVFAAMWAVFAVRTEAVDAVPA